MPNERRFECHSETLVQEQPCSWILYNNILCFYKDATIQPGGHGLFFPSLWIAESLLP
jgi:hypothetical protein